MSTKERGTTRQRLRDCPICGSNSWPIAYGMMTSDAQEKSPQTIFAGCYITSEQRVYPRTGRVEYGVPQWACQNAECSHEWW